MFTTREQAAVLTSNAQSDASVPTIEIASSRFAVKSALHLVYDAYVRSGLIEPHQHEIRVTPYHLLPTTEVLVALVDGEVACTATLVRDGAFGLPLESIFTAEVAARRARGVACAEASCLADRREDNERGFPLLAKLMSFTIQCALYRGVEELLIAVHPRHARFYQKFLGFEMVNDEERSYEAVRDNPAVMLSLDIPQLQMTATPAHRRVFGHEFSPAQMRRHVLPMDLIPEFRQIVNDTYYDGACTLSRDRFEDPTPYSPEAYAYRPVA